MDTRQIEDILKEHCADFVGVFSSDAMPSFLKPGQLLVVNTDCVCKPGRHWLGIYVRGKNQMEVFDSYGRNLKNYPFLLRPRYSYLRNSHQLQSELTAVCGQWTVLYCLYKQYGGGSLQSFVRHFSKHNRLANDIQVWQYVNDRFNLRLPLRDPTFNISL